MDGEGEEDLDGDVGFSDLFAALEEVGLLGCASHIAWGMRSSLSVFNASHTPTRTLFCVVALRLLCLTQHSSSDYLSNLQVCYRLGVFVHVHTYTHTGHNTLGRRQGCCNARTAGHVQLGRQARKELGFKSRSAR